MSDEPEESAEDEDRDYNSGPYCHGYQDPSDCDEMCECGHECHEHRPAGIDDVRNYEACRHEGCACEDFTKAT